MKYELLENVLLRTNLDGTISSIPLDPANADYQEYLAANEPSSKL